MKKERTSAIVLAAGQGKRMGTKTAKQFLEINDKPVLYYAVQAFEESNVDDIVVVTSADNIEYVTEKIVKEYSFKKVVAVVEGGKERYHSVANGLSFLNDYYKKEKNYEEICKENNQEITNKIIEENNDNVPNKMLADDKIVLIHDGARPLVSVELINDLIEQTKKYDACVTGTPVKDTVKIADADGFCDTTPNRSLVWTVQTPQTFKFDLVYYAYMDVIQKEEELKNQGILITDDAMVVEYMTSTRVKLIMGDYKNMKLTTPEDLQIAKLWLDEKP